MDSSFPLGRFSFVLSSISGFISWPGLFCSLLLMLFDWDSGVMSMVLLLGDLRRWGEGDRAMLVVVFMNKTGQDRW